MKYRIYLRFLYIISAIIIFSSCVSAGKKVCSIDESIAAESTSATIQTWEQLFSSFRKYAHCDDGAIAEGYSESVSLLLSNHWRDLNQIVNLINTNLSFQLFILNHIDETVPISRLKIIKENADRSCHEDLSVFCQEINKQFRSLQLIETVN